jgi:hypothetical protein
MLALMLHRRLSSRGERAMLLAFAVIALIVALEAIVSVAVAQDSAAVDQVATDLCANNGALIHWAYAALASTPAVASVLAAIAVALKRWLPAPIRGLLYALSLNWVKDLADRAAQPKPLSQSGTKS